MSSGSGLRVVLAEDSLLLREGLARLFHEAGFDLVASYGDAEALIEDLDRTAPDLAVLDVRMPPSFRDEGVRAAIAVHGLRPATGVLLLSQYAEAEYARDLLTAAPDGGVGYLLKDRVSSLDELREAATRIAEGGTVLDEQLVRQLFERRRHPLHDLTRRERDVLALMAEGRTNHGIAHALVISVGSVEKHATAIFAKLGLDDDSAGSHRRVLAVLAWLQR